MSTETTTRIPASPPLSSSDLLDCAAKLKAMSHEHKATHEAAQDTWERAYHLGAATALQDARLEVLAAIIQMQSNAPAQRPPGTDV